MKNLDKNLLGNIIILVSLILVIICFFMIITSSVTGVLNTTQAEWNGYKYFIESDSQVEENSSDVLKITSPYSTHNIELRKTKDQTAFNEHFNSEDGMWSKSEYNSTHTYLSDDSNPFAVIVPNDALEMKDGHYVLKENTEFIEVYGEDPMYMMSFTASHEEVK